MHIEKSAKFGRCIAGSHGAVQALELLLHGAQRLRQPLDLGGHLIGSDGVMRDLERGMRHELRAADGDAAGDADAMQEEAHRAAACRAAEYEPPNLRVRL